MGARIDLAGVSKHFENGLAALEDVSLSLARGQFVSIVGPSGCGKSTLLRVIAGLIAPSRGSYQRPADIETAFVFQDAALLPWRTVADNAELLMELEGYGTAERRSRAQAALELVGLGGFERSYPHQLSGGMRMRLSLARALALQPDLLLLDEPLAAVDELTRDVLQEELLQLWKQAGFTAVLVTHSVHEAVFLSDRIVVMSPRPGRILDIIDVPFAFPRTSDLRAQPAFAELTGRVSAALRAHSPPLTTA
jgi:NitT/TauT family transport system ATP-binding protein